MIVLAVIAIAYPLRSTLQPARLSLVAAYPEALKPVALAFENWIIVVLYEFINKAI